MGRPRTYIANLTASDGVETTRGLIPHKRITMGGITFAAPVALDLEVTDKGRCQVRRVGANRPVPRETGDGFLYALPGGGLTI